MIEHAAADKATLIVMQIVLQNGWQDPKFIEERCENFAEFRRTVEKYHPELVSAITGVSTEELYKAAEILARNKPMATIWAMGITQHTTGILNVLSLANLQMLLGNMGMPGGGVNPLRGQNNVQGACDMGGSANVFPGYQAVTDANFLSNFSAAWALEDSSRVSQGATTLGIPGEPGLTVTEMVEAYGAGKLRLMRSRAKPTFFPAVRNRLISALPIEAKELIMDDRASSAG